MSTKKRTKKATKKTTKAPVEQKVDADKGDVPVTDPAEPITDDTVDTGESGDTTGEHDAPTQDQEAPKGEPVKETVAATAPAPIRPKDPRLPVDGIIERQYKGKLLQVKVLDKGFEHEGEFFTSLSKLAKVITGQKSINGFAFFKLGKAAGKTGE